MITDKKTNVSPMTSMERAARKDKNLARMAALETAEDLNQKNAEEMVLASDPDAKTVRGNAIGGRRNLGTQNKRPSTQKKQDAYEILAALAALKSNPLIKEIEEIISLVRQAFVTASSVPEPTVLRFEDDQYIYETAMVTRETARILDAEAAEIAQKLKDLETIRDEETRRVEAAKIVMLAEEYQMRRHPVTGRFVHDIARVDELEALHNPKNEKVFGGAVCVFRVKEQIGHDDRGIKKSISDVVGRDDCELTDAEKAVIEAQKPQPVLPPHLQLIHR